MEPAMGKATSRDGTPIAYWRSGTGPPLVLVHGMAGDHLRWGPLLPHLEPHATVHAMDRRGRGASGDAPEYGVAREFEDVAAVVDAVAAATGSAVDLLGHSYGGLCAFGGAGLTANVRRLALYEGWPLVDPAAYPLPASLQERLDALLAQGDRDTLLTTVMREIAGLTEEQINALKAAPSWPARIAAAHTIPRELRAEQTHVFNPAQAAAITAPTLLLVGGDSPGHLKNGYETVAAAVPDARGTVLEGHQHGADILEPNFFAQRLLTFLREGS
ncbi:MAG: alpha/beta hydrolase [Dehalococcoidia bacterium]